MQSAFIDQGLKLATAESCTGGLVSYALTEIAGSSDYYLGGIVSYSNAAKMTQLGVPVATLDTHGAVSAQTAVAMADGARLRFGADVAVSVTGVAGPGGGSATKPVGLVYVAVADAHGHEVRRIQRHGDRHDNRTESARECLELLLARVGAA